jgi:protein O-GlcNAc transferase
MLGRFIRSIGRSLYRADPGRELSIRRPDLLEYAINLISSNNLDEAQRVLDGIVTERPDEAEALHQLARIALKQDRFEEAVGYLERALITAPNAARIYVTYGNVRRSRGELELAAQLYSRALDADVDCVEANLNLAMVACEQGELKQGITLLEKVARMNPASFVAHHNLGNALRAQGEFEAAARSYRRALRIDPGAGDTHFALGLSLKALGQHETALAAFHTALERGVKDPELFHNMGHVYYEMGRLQQAKNVLERAISSQPDVAELHNGLATILLATGELQGAIRGYRRAVQLDPSFADGYNNLGMALFKSGEFAGAKTAFRRALDIRPEFAEAHSNLILSLSFDPQVSLEEHLAERYRWRDQHVRRSNIRSLPHRNTRTPGHKLRVGYVSADLRQHSAICGFGPMLLHYDRSAFEVVCYSNSLLEDEFTRRFKASVDSWRSIIGMPDADATRLIQRDRIDILVDLSGHSAGNRLLVFARKPAPLQVTAWGYVTGTGLDAIDYIFADKITIPDDARRYYSEEVVHLPCVVTYMPQAAAPSVAPLPAQRNGFITYGCFNNYAKLSPDALALWARLAKLVPGSRMLFKAREFDHPHARERVSQIFAAAGVGFERLIFLGQTPWYEHLAAHAAADVSLDPFPQGGGISTLDALWMGIPVVTLQGKTVSSRISTSILKVVGLSDWTAETPQEYLDIACRQAREIPRLAQLRGSLRERAAATAVGNSGEYVRAVEAVYKDLWERWCATQP